MNNLRRTILIMLIGFCGVINLNAQLLLTEYQAQKVEGDKIKIRWEPKNGDEWVASKSVGYTIEKYRISSSGVEESIGKEVILPASKKEWMKYENSTSDFLHEFVMGARSFVHPDSDEKKNQFDKIFDLQGDQSKNNKLSLGFLMYSASYDFEIAKLAGLGYEMAFEKGFTYKFVLRTATSSPITIVVNPENYQASSVPELTAEWRNKEVEMKWDGSNHQGDFLGYMISKSEDGLTYVNLNERPRTNSLGLVSDTSALLQMGYLDSLAENYKTYWYKVEGFDYFGGISTTKQIVSGQGYDVIRMSPIVEYADQTEDNHAHIKWYMPEEMEKLVDNYRITRSENDQGPYEIVIDSIDKATKEIKIPLGTTQNHFRVEAVPYRGKPVGSIPVFIMGQDTIPPAVPEILSATIDSLGIIELKWKSNTENDLWGYRIFKSNFDEQEYALMNSEIKKDTIYRDTVDINFNIENVFYKIYATDIRDNKSDFTAPVKLERPDIFAPGMAGIGKLEQKNDSIFISWKASASKDVVHHHIFRRAINLENSWTLIGILENDKIGTPFVDTGLDFGVPYAYTIIAYDDAGLKSDAATPKKITLHKPREVFDPNINVSYAYDEKNNEIKLSWDMREKDRIEHIIVYRGTTQNKLGKYKVLDAEEVMLTEMASSDEKLYYKVKPVYFEQTEDYYSETVEVVMVKGEE